MSFYIGFRSRDNKHGATQATQLRGRGSQPLRKRLCILISLPTRWKSSGPNLTALNRVKLAVVENLAEIVASMS